MVAMIKTAKPDLRMTIEGAKIVQEKDAPLKTLRMIQRLRKRLKRRKVRRENEDILRAALDDATITSNVSIPKTLAEALPEDAQKKNNDPRAIVVTEATGRFNMIGCNKAWEVRPYFFRYYLSTSSSSHDRLTSCDIPESLWFC